MKLTRFLSALRSHPFRILIAVATVAPLLPGSPLLFAQQPGPAVQTQAATATAPAEAEAPAPKIPNDQLDSLVAPIALYPDPLLVQVLASSTYPLEIVQLAQWMGKNPSLKDKALADALAKQPWDASVQSLGAYPDVVKQLSENVAWSSDLGNAFLAQQSDVMDAVQRMRAKAQGTGNLKTSAQQKVETETVDNKQVIVIEPADPEVIYVPQYSPTVVYGAPIYPYPYYPPPYYGALAFGAGIAIGAIWGGAWGNCNWRGGGDININNNNNFNRNTNVNGGNRNQINNRPANGGGGGKWSHNPSHRGGAPYGDRGTANKYGGNARQQPANANRPGAGGAGAGNRPGGGAGAGNVGVGNRPGGGAGAGNAGAGNRPGGGAGAGNVGAGNRPGGGAGAGNVGAGGGNRASTMPASRPSGGGSSAGNRGVSSGSSFGSSSSAFGGGSGSSARSSSSRGGSSMGGGGFSGGGGGSRGGGGGGGRGGGGGGGGRRR